MTRLLALALSLTLLVDSLPAPLGVSFVGHAAAQSRDELYAKCRRAIFRRYGQPGVQYNLAPPGVACCRLNLPSERLISASPPADAYLRPEEAASRAKARRLDVRKEA